MPTEQQLQRIFQLKKQLVGAAADRYAAAGPAREAIDEINDLPGFEAGTRNYFRDVYDHMIRVSDLIDSYRDLLTGALDVYLSTVSNRLNTVMKRLTVVATIFLPLDLHDRVLRPELRLDGAPHRHVRGLHDLRRRRPGRVHDRAAAPCSGGPATSDESRRS